MTLADRLSEPQLVKKGPACSVATILRRSTEEDAAALTAALADERFLLAHIHAALQAEGHPISQGTLRRHRRGECACARYGAT